MAETNSQKIRRLLNESYREKVGTKVGKDLSNVSIKDVIEIEQEFDATQKESFFSGGLSTKKYANPVKVVDNRKKKN
jgi:hypothetical protein